MTTRSLGQRSYCCIGGVAVCIHLVLNGYAAAHRLHIGKQCDEQQEISVIGDFLDSIIHDALPHKNSPICHKAILRNFRKE